MVSSGQFKMAAEDPLFHVELDPELPPHIKEIAVQNGEDDSRTYLVIEELKKEIFKEDSECQPHRTDDEYLKKFLRARFWNFDNAYKLMCNYYRLRKENSQWYENVHITDIIRICEKNIVEVSPYRDQNGCRIMTVRFGAWDPNTTSIDDVFKIVMFLLEMGSMEPQTQVCGGIGVFDLENVGMSHIMHLTPSIAQKILALIVTSMPVRTCAVHIVNQGWFFSAVLRLFKPLLSEKMSERLFIHGYDMNSLHKHIEPKYLSKRYGGVHDDYPHTMWIDAMKKQSKLAVDLEQLGYVVNVTQ